MNVFDGAKAFQGDRGTLAEVNRRVIEEFRANGGVVGGPFAGAPLLLLTTTGALTGRARLVPLANFTVDDRTLVAGSFAGSPTAPAWVHNLRANPQVLVEVGTRAYTGVARELSRAERDAMFPRVVEQAPILGRDQAKTRRLIPLFELTAR